MITPIWAKIVFAGMSLGGIGGFVSGLVLGNIENKEGPKNRTTRRKTCREWDEEFRRNGDSNPACIEA